VTSETRTTIQLSDIQAIEFECRACHCRITRPMGGRQILMLICPECETTWANYRGDMEILTKIASQIARLAGIDDPKNQAPFVVRFEITTERKP
jgi:hypothetical protein